MTNGAADARIQAAGHVDAPRRRAWQERLWPPALFFLVFRTEAIETELRSRKPDQAGRTKSPFVYDMR